MPTPERGQGEVHQESRHMSTRYDPNHKAAAMVVLERNRGDIQTTAHQTGIPDRTLRTWRGSILPYLPPPPPDARQQPAELPAFESDLDALAFIRQNILGELSRLSASLQYDSGFFTPYQRALVLSQLMDKLLKPDVHLEPYTPREQQKIRIEFVDEQGNVHDKMPDSDDPEDYEFRYDDEWGDDAADDNHDNHPA